jgi:hypothetical protein
MNAKPVIHRITTSAFKPAALHGKRLRRFEDEHPIDCGLEVSDVQPDGSFLLWAVYGSADQGVPNGGRGHLHLGKESVDQATADMIEEARSFPLLHGCDFVIFDRSPKRREDYIAKS